jgi:hypothetical protein
MNLEGQAHGEVDSSTALNGTMGVFSPPKEDKMHGVVNIDPTLICLITLSNNCSFPRFVDNKDKILNMFCAQCLQ